MRKTLNKARDLFFWKGIGKDIRKHVLTFPVCQAIEGERYWSTQDGELGRFFVYGRSWSVIGVDTVKVAGNSILTVTDLCTRYVFAVVLSSEKAAVVAGALEKIFWAEGAPSVVVTDNGTYFKSLEF